MFVDLLDITSPRPAPTPLVGSELSHGFRWRCLRCLLWFRLTDAPVDGDSGLLLHLVCDMSVHIQRGSAGDVTDDGGQGLDIHPMLQGIGGECVS